MQQELRNREGEWDQPERVVDSLGMSSVILHFISGIMYIIFVLQQMKEREEGNEKLAKELANQEQQLRDREGDRDQAERVVDSLGTSSVILHLYQVITYIIFVTGEGA